MQYDSSMNITLMFYHKLTMFLWPMMHFSLVMQYSVCSIQYSTFFEIAVFTAFIGPFDEPDMFWCFDLCSRSEAIFTVRFLQYIKVGRYFVVSKQTCDYRKLGQFHDFQFWSCSLFVWIDCLTCWMNRSLSQNIDKLILFISGRLFGRLM